MTVNLEAATYDETVRNCVRVIVWCEMEKMRLRAQLLLLTLEEAVAQLLDPARARELEELRQSIEEAIRQVQQLEDSTRSFLAQLRRDHGQINAARRSAPNIGAEKSYHVETGAPR